MANDENTAVNELIARAHGGPSSSGSGGSGPNATGSAPPCAAMFTTAPIKMPVAAPFEAPTSYPVVPRPAAPMPPVLPPPLDPNMPGGPGPGPRGFAGGYGGPGGPHDTGAPPWAATVPLNAPRPPRSRNQEHLVGTIRLNRRSERQVMFSKLVIPMALLVVVGMLAGGYVAMHGEGASKVAARAADPAPAVVTAPAAAAPPPPIVEPAPAAIPPPAPVAPAPAPVVAPAVDQKPALVDVRIDSTPSGATVTLVDRGKTQLVGNTPISAAFDPSREYDLVFSYPNKPTRVEHILLGATRRISVTLGAAMPTTPEEPRAAPAVPAASPAPAAAATGAGTLMISTKPPCEILIDGRATGLTTPQRALSLPAGAHQITLVNAEKGIQKTVSVRVEASATEKIIEDFLK